MRYKVNATLATVLLAISFFNLHAGAQTSTRTVFDFRQGDSGWQANFADYNPNFNEGNRIFELDSGIRTLPPELNDGGTAFYIQGHNRSADLFMFLKRRLDAGNGIMAGRKYQVNFKIVFASQAQNNCFGIGGAPGESVTLKAGATTVEPLPSAVDNRDLRMNIDKGNQSTGGRDAGVVGNIANGVECGAEPNSFVTLSRTYNHEATVTANANGELWLIVGTDSGFEGLTRLYYQQIEVTLVSQDPPRKQRNGLRRSRTHGTSN